MAAADLPAALSSRLLPASVGHVAHARASPSRPLVPPECIEAFAPRVAALLGATRATGVEHGFLAYAPAEPGLPPVAEDDAVGGPDEIRWHWRERDATVAFSVHTHPGEDALCVPSGMDAVGALVRGDHLVYVLTTDGRLSGWRFADPAGHPRAVVEAMRALDRGRALNGAVVDFLYDAFEAMRPGLLEAAYAARVREDGALERARMRGFFSRAERARGAGRCR